MDFVVNCRTMYMMCIYLCVVFLCFAEDYGRLIEISDFPEGMITRDLLVLFKEFR